MNLIQMVKDFFTSDNKTKYWHDTHSVWEFMRHADEGTGPFKDMSILTKHPREQFFEERKNYSHYQNYFKLMLSRLVEPLFKDAPLRIFDEKHKSNKVLQAFMNDCDRKGNSFADVIKNQARKIKRNSLYFCIVDNDTDIAMTENEALEKRQFPYISFKSPESFYKGRTDSAGNLISVTFKEAGTDSEGKPETHYREWNVGSWRLYRIEKDEEITIDDGDIGIPVLPVVSVYTELPDEESDSILTLPELYHIVRATVTLTNQQSEIRELERKQGFSMLHYPATEATMGKMPAEMTTGPNNVLVWDGQHSSTPPDYISPDPAIPESIAKNMDWIKNELFTLARIHGLMPKKSAESGESKEWDFVATDESLNNFGDILEAFERDIMYRVGLYLNIKDTGYSVSYNDKFGIQDPIAAQELAAADLQMDMPPAFKKYIKKDYASIRIQDKEILDPILEEIENMAEDDLHGNPDPDKQLDPVE